jgi:hypothetical protein
MNVRTLITAEWKEQNLPLVPYRIELWAEGCGREDYLLTSSDVEVGWATIFDNQFVDLDLCPEGLNEVTE